MQRLLVLVFCLVAATTAHAADKGQGPLPSWSEGPLKDKILAYIESVATEGSPHFVPRSERIATFDNDGTLWAEKPIYFQVAFTIDRVRKLAPQHPEWQNEEPFKSVLSGDQNYIERLTDLDYEKLTIAVSTNLPVSEYKAEAANWLKTAKHPRFNKLYVDLVYEPMVELLRYVRSRGFKTYVVSGGDQSFMRNFTDEKYGIPPEQVIGSYYQLDFRIDGPKSWLFILPQLLSLDINAQKPINIERFIGRRPILAAGNSDGDIEMLEYTDGSPYKNLELLVHHDDAKREYAYDSGTVEALKIAGERRWSVVSMKKDFREIFAPK